MHLRGWVWCCINAIRTKTAAITPNIAYVTDQAVPGVTVKACQRGLMGLAGRGFGASTEVGNGWDYGTKTLTTNTSWDYGRQWSGRDGAASQPVQATDPVGCSSGGHSWLTIGEYRSKALSVVKPHEELEPVEADHPARRVYENPNPVDTQYDVDSELITFLELCGIAYEWTPKNAWGYPAERWCIPSHWVWPRTGGGKYVSPDHPHADELIQYYEVRPWGGMGSAGSLRFPPDEVTEFRFKSPLNKIDGYGPTQAGAQWIDSDESITKSRWSQFINQARPELWIELGPGYEDPNDDRIARIEAKFAAKLQGEFNYGKPLVTPAGAKANVLSFSPTEMAYFQSAEQTKAFIAALFSLPLSWIGDIKDMTYGSVLASLGAGCSNCINPLLTMIGQTRTKHQMSRWDERVPAWSTLSGKGYGSSSRTRKMRLFYDDCVPADPQQVNSDIAQDLQGYSITPDEIRALRGRKPYPKYGNVPWVQGPGGIMPFPMHDDNLLDELAQQIKPMAELGQEEPGAAPEVDTGKLPEHGQGFPSKVPGHGESNGSDTPGDGVEVSAGAAGDGGEGAGAGLGSNSPKLASKLPKPKPQTAGIAEPNGPPSKEYTKEFLDGIDGHEELVELARRFYEAGPARYHLPEPKDGEAKPAGKTPVGDDKSSKTTANITVEILTDKKGKQRKKVTVAKPDGRRTILETVVGEEKTSADGKRSKRVKITTPDGKRATFDVELSDGKINLIPAR